MVEEQQTKINHFMNDAENKQVIIYKLQRKLEEQQSKLDELYSYVKKSETHNIDYKKLEKIYKS